MSILGPCPNAKEIFSKYSPELLEKFRQIYEAIDNEEFAFQLIQSLTPKETALLEQYNEDHKLIRKYLDDSKDQYNRYEEEIKNLDKIIEAKEAQKVEILNKYIDSIVEEAKDFRIYNNNSATISPTTYTPSNNYIKKNTGFLTQKTPAVVRNVSYTQNNQPARNLNGKTPYPNGNFDEEIKRLHMENKRLQQEIDEKTKKRCSIQ